ncbi:ATP-dependent DNA helicase [Serinicoccus hydrothermalis]|uniref:DNA 3'-5' helicase n=1 Tax=Serinicoccus hydrothermalis TaxID=1758689 RepID=A0A1B1NG70_9MICO|nr:ATP-dependent DNA helicase [Serinicoccus hydrothermalis]ANS80417.1 ATP-dependent DNA helicase [Serinicoccus hydrothermalis]
MSAPEPRWSPYDLARALGAPEPTDEQAAVITAPPRPGVVIAGAGSGKTETMASRVLWLVANGIVAPQDVLGLTFTRKAALELAARLTSRLRQLREAGLWADPAGETAGADGFDLPTISTYHAYAGRLVAEHGLRLGVEPDAVLLSEAACWQLAHDVVTRYDGDMTGMTSAPSTVVRSVIALSSELGEHLVEADRAREFLLDLARHAEDLPHEGRPLKTGRDLAADLRRQALVYPLVQAYREAKTARGALDFGDQMALAARLARDVPAVAAAERARVGAVLLDEFQDTSEAQMVLLTSLFAGQEMPVTAVGDPHQSIYAWRGASATTLTRFPREFALDGAPPPVLQLSTSWRNDAAVLDAANLVAGPLREQAAVPVGTLHARPGAGEGVLEVARLVDHVVEAEHVAGWVHERWAACTPGRVTAAVLCRARSQFAPVVDALRRRGLPVEVVGLGGLLDTPEVLDLVALLWVAQEPTRGDQVVRLLAGPVARLGAADLDALWAWAGELARGQGAGAPGEREHAPVLAEALEHPPRSGWVGRGGEQLSPEAAGRVSWLATVVRQVRSLTSLPLADLVLETERLLGLDIEVAADPDLHPTWGRAPLDALAEVAAGYAYSAERVSLGGFLDWLDAAREHERGLEDAEVPELAEVSVDTAAVQVLTVHAAKGLEWDVVAVPGMVEGTFPAGRTTPEHRDGRWRVKERTDRGWLAGIGKLPTPLRGDRAGRPDVSWSSVTDTRDLRTRLEELSLAQGRYAVEEERRLAYVALTRARHRLLLTAPVWSTGLRPRITSRFLEELRGLAGVHVGPWVDLPDPQDEAQMRNPRLDEQLSATWPRPHSRDERRAEVRDVAAALLAEGATRGAPADLPGDQPWAETVELLLAERDRRSGPEESPALPAHLSTSAVVELAADRAAFVGALRRPVPTPPAPHARVGTAFHAWVEQHYSAATLVDLDDPDAEAESPGGPDLAGLRRHFLDSEWSGRTPVAVEVPVQTTVAGRTVAGRIDAVFDDGDGGVTVVDWKTGSPGSPAQQQARAVQLAVYRLAFARLSGRTVHEVRAAFFYAATGTTVRPDLPTEEELGLLLADEPAQVRGSSSAGMP